METPCTNEQVKKAFLLSCFVGLRLGDVRELTWAKVMNTKVDAVNLVSGFFG